MGGMLRFLLIDDIIGLSRMKLAIFDLDNTLLAGDSDYTWGEFLVGKGIVDKDEYQQENDRFYVEYQQKTLNILEYQRFVLTPLINLNKDQLSALHNEFMETHIAPLRQAKADALIQQHRSQGDKLLVITATNHFIAEPIVTALGINDLLATDPEIIDGRFTGEIVGYPCFQEGKIERLKLWLAQTQQAYSDITFYSDSINDVPLLAFADTAIAVDPDEALTEMAKEKGWPIISLRDDM
jgi:HAD superfamily hydrolase (TIGR01490 family)